MMITPPTELRRHCHDVSAARLVIAPLGVAAPIEHISSDSIISSCWKHSTFLSYVPAGLHARISCCFLYAMESLLVVRNGGGDVAITSPVVFSAPHPD